MLLGVPGRLGQYHCPLLALLKKVVILAVTTLQPRTDMPIVATPEVGIPLPFDTTPEELEDFRLKAHALFETIQDLVEHGASFEITDEDKRVSHVAAIEGKLPPVKEITPGMIINLEAILSEWDHEVLDVSRRLRNYVTNKFIAASTDPDPKISMRALENLGKISSVGLFDNRIDITVTHRTAQDIQTELAKTLEIYMGQAQQVEELPTKPKAIADINLDDELGPEEEYDDEE